MKYIFIIIIKLYRLTLSKILPPCCRFYPSCSQYGLTAVTRFGAVKGGYLTIKRIIRCNPLTRAGMTLFPRNFISLRKIKRKIINIVTEQKKGDLN